MKKILVLGLGALTMSAFLVGCSDGKNEMKNPIEKAGEANQMIDKVAEVQIVEDKDPVQFGDFTATLNQVATTPEDLLIVDLTIRNEGKKVASLITNELELRCYEDAEYKKLVNVYLPTLIDGSIDIQAGESKNLTLTYAYGEANGASYNSLLRFKTFEKDELHVKDVPIQNYVNVQLSE
ncbi:hypothetical protein ABD91_20280 [Lysinibacillus sphaericus]|uniref:hypothetical protein n=1 Tax=Lysinibacillus sphaericus TaxID=1421 RepID=UPI0018CDC477|nr:hypothetical protein [Lysinibacillus sphaericus]MBG9693088.1 hypothetical protein [Lysinibacillus sphaericus]